MRICVCISISVYCSSEVFLPVSVYTCVVVVCSMLNCYNLCMYNVACVRGVV